MDKENLNFLEGVLGSVKKKSNYIKNAKMSGKKKDYLLKINDELISKIYKEKNYIQKHTHGDVQKTLDIAAGLNEISILSDKFDSEYSSFKQEYEAPVEVVDIYPAYVPPAPEPIVPPVAVAPPVPLIPAAPPVPVPVPVPGPAPGPVGGPVGGPGLGIGIANGVVVLNTRRAYKIAVDAVVGRFPNIDLNLITNAINARNDYIAALQASGDDLANAEVKANNAVNTSYTNARNAYINDIRNFTDNGPGAGDVNFNNAETKKGEFVAVSKCLGNNNNDAQNDANHVIDSEVKNISDVYFTNIDSIRSANNYTEAKNRGNAAYLNYKKYKYILMYNNIIDENDAHNNIVNGDTIKNIINNLYKDYFNKVAQKNLFQLMNANGAAADAVLAAGAVNHNDTILKTAKGKYIYALVAIGYTSAQASTKATQAGTAATAAAAVAAAAVPAAVPAAAPDVDLEPLPFIPALEVPNDVFILQPVAGGPAPAPGNMFGNMFNGGNAVLGGTVLGGACFAAWPVVVMCVVVIVLLLVLIFMLLPGHAQQKNMCDRYNYIYDDPYDYDENGHLLFSNSSYCRRYK